MIELNQNLDDIEVLLDYDKEQITTLKNLPALSILWMQKTKNVLTYLRKRLLHQRREG